MSRYQRMSPAFRYREPMAVAAYSAWKRAGKPVWPANPVKDIVDRLKVAYPAAAAQNLFSWYANEAHLTAVPAQDHTPFSQTGWPLASPEWYVFATDVMHRPDLGVDCGALFPYWLSEAKAGRMPWLKYLIWQAKIYDVRNDWRPQSNSGHFDHIHISTRTDHRTTALGSWQLIPHTQELDVPMYCKAVPSGRQIVTNGTSWAWISNPTTWGSHKYVAGLNGVTIPDPMPEIPDDQLDSGAMFGYEVRAPVSPQAPGPLTPEQLEQVGMKAYDGAQSGVSDSLDGATVTTTIHASD